MKINIKPLLLALGLGLVLLGPQQSSAYYNLSTGRWISRDPAEEDGGNNLFTFVSNQPQLKFDRLGLAGYQYSEGAPTGIWFVTRDDGIEWQIDQDVVVLKGFRSRYQPSRSPPCPCEKENIILVQAVQATGYPAMMDNPKAYAKYQHIKGTPIPDYWLFTPDWLIKQRKNPLEIVDAPLHGGTETDRFTWRFEDCAVCRRKLKDGTVSDVVLGCITFDFVRHMDRTAELRPQSTVLTTAKSPTALWKKALQHWTKWTDT